MFSFKLRDNYAIFYTRAFICLLRFPGAIPSDNVINLLKLFMSKEPNSTIRSQVSLEGGYNLCTEAQFLSKNYTCRKGFVSDSRNRNCYKVLNIVTNETVGNNSCNPNSLLSFTKDREVEGFMDLLKTGSICLNKYVILGQIQMISAYGLVH